MHGGATYHEVAKSSGIAITGSDSDEARGEKIVEGSRVNVAELTTFGITGTGDHRAGTSYSISSERLHTPVDGQVGSGLLGMNEGSESMVELVTW